MSRLAKDGTYRGRPRKIDLEAIKKEGKSNEERDIDEAVEKLSDEALKGGGNALVTPEQASAELKRRKTFERYRYYKIPKYFDGLAKSSAHTKVLCCPNKVGKSTFAIMSAFWYAMGMHPFRPNIAVPNTSWLMGPTLAHVNEVFIDGMRRWGLTKFWLKYSEKRGKLTWINGSVTYVKSYDERKNLQGRSIHTIFIDEECPNDIWNEIIFRFEAGEQMDIYITATPLEGEEWFADICDRAEAGEEGLYIAPSISIRDALEVNGGHLSEKDVLRVEQLCKDEMERDIRMHGKRLRRAGAVLALEDGVHRVGRERLPGGEIPKEWVKVVGIDPHPRKPTSVVWIAIDPVNGDAFVYDHERLSGTAKQQAAAVKERNKGQSIFAIYMDPASQDSMTSNMSEINWNYFDEFFSEYPTVALIKSVRSRDFVIDSVRYRINYDHNKPITESNRPHFFILRDSKLDDYYKSLKAVRWQEYKDRQLFGAKEQVRKGNEDDLMATGYVLVKHPLYVPSFEEQVMAAEHTPLNPVEFRSIYPEMGY